MSDDLYQKRARDVMSKRVVCVHADDLLHDALAMMDENRLSALPVVDRQNRCIGIISATDLINLTLEVSDGVSDLTSVNKVLRNWLLENLAEQDLAKQPVEKVMTADVARVDPETPLVMVAADMLRHRVHRLPVVDAQNCVLGIISTADILSAFVESAK